MKQVKGIESEEEGATGGSGCGYPRQCCQERPVQGGHLDISLNEVRPEATSRSEGRTFQA